MFKSQIKGYIISKHNRTNTSDNIDFIYYIMDVNGVSIGVVFTDLIEHTIELSELNVNKNAQGKGIGSDILRIFDEIAVCHKCYNQILCVDVNTPAYDWYKRREYYDDHLDKCSDMYMWLRKTKYRYLFGL